MHTALFTHIRRFVPLTAAEESMLIPLLDVVHARKKDFLHHSGDICTHNHFVVHGVVRMYSHTDAGTEQIVQFGIDNWWITDYTSLDTGKPSVFSIQVVEDAVIIRISRTNLEHIYQQVPAMERYFRKILQRAFSASLMRFDYIFNESGEERYRNFQRLFPDFVQRVPQYMLASYLGFTPEFLSKIRSKKT